MTAYYNEIDAFDAAWIRELMAQGMIANGEVDERSIEDVVPADLVGFTQCHFFAGIVVWSYALRQAGWPDDKPVWTGSCPCQPFSAAGKGGGLADERNLWPAFEWLIRQCRPNVVLGEQVESAIKHDWLDHVVLSLEDIGYAVGPIGFPACSVGAPHKRMRLYWVADSCFRSGERNPRSVLTEKAQRSSQRKHNGYLPIGHPNGCPARLLADAENPDGRPGECGAQTGAGKNGERRRGSSSGCNAGELGDSGGTGLQERCQPGTMEAGRAGATAHAPGPTNGFWSDAEWIPCRDGKARPVEPGTFPLVDGATNRVGRLRGYGNAIVAPQAEAFIRAYLDIIG